MKTRISVFQDIQAGELSVGCSCPRLHCTVQEITPQRNNIQMRRRANLTSLGCKIEKCSKVRLDTAIDESRGKDVWSMDSCNAMAITEKLEGYPLMQCPQHQRVVLIQLSKACQQLAALCLSSYRSHRKQGHTHVMYRSGVLENSVQHCYIFTQEAEVNIIGIEGEFDRIQWINLTEHMVNITEHEPASLLS